MSWAPFLKLFLKQLLDVLLKKVMALGLTISREFIALMGGNLNVRSKESKGTNFFFDIEVKIVRETSLKEKANH